MCFIHSFAGAICFPYFVVSLLFFLSFPICVCVFFYFILVRFCAIVAQCKIHWNCVRNVIAPLPRHYGHHVIPWVLECVRFKWKESAVLSVGFFLARFCFGTVVSRHPSHGSALLHQIFRYNCNFDVLRVSVGHFSLLRTRIDGLSDCASNDGTGCCINSLSWRSDDWIYHNRNAVITVWMNRWIAKHYQWFAINNNCYCTSSTIYSWV